MLESNAGLPSFLKDRSPDGWLRAPAQLCSTAAGCLLPQASSGDSLVNFVLLFPQHGEKSLAAGLFLKPLLAFLHHIGHDICKIPPERAFQSKVLHRRRWYGTKGLSAELCLTRTEEFPAE